MSSLIDDTDKEKIEKSIEFAEKFNANKSFYETNVWLVAKEYDQRFWEQVFITACQRANLDLVKWTTTIYDYDFDEGIYFTKSSEVAKFLINDATQKQKNIDYNYLLIFAFEYYGLEIATLAIDHGAWDFADALSFGRYCNSETAKFFITRGGVVHDNLLDHALLNNDLEFAEFVIQRGVKNVQKCCDACLAMILTRPWNASTQSANAALQSTDAAMRSQLWSELALLLTYGGHIRSHQLQGFNLQNLVYEHRLSLSALKRLDAQLPVRREFDCVVTALAHISCQVQTFLISNLSGIIIDFLVNTM